MKKQIVLLIMLIAGIATAGALDITFDLKDLNQDIPLEDLRWLTKTVDTGLIYASIAYGGMFHFAVDKPLEGTLLTAGKWLGYGMVGTGLSFISTNYMKDIGMGLVIGGLVMDVLVTMYDISAGKDYLERKQAEIILKYRQKPGA